MITMSLSRGPVFSVDCQVRNVRHVPSETVPRVGSTSSMKKKNKSTRSSEEPQHQDFECFAIGGGLYAFIGRSTKTLDLSFVASFRSLTLLLSVNRQFSVFLHVGSVIGPRA